MNKSIRQLINYQMAAVWSRCINEPTKYKGRGRPRKTDYELLEHPFDKKITKRLYK